MSPIELTAHFLTQQNTQKFHQYKHYGGLRQHSVEHCVATIFEDCEIPAWSAGSTERRQALKALGDSEDSLRPELAEVSLRVRLKQKVSNFRLRTEVISLVQK
jgi:hypothetical protein